MSLFSFSQYTVQYIYLFLLLTKHVSRFLFLTKTVSIYLFPKQYVSRSHEVSYCTFSSSEKCIFIYFTFSQNVYLSLSHKMCISVFLSVKLTKVSEQLLQQRLSPMQGQLEKYEKIRIHLNL